eukprot:g3332.t1
MYTYSAASLLRNRRGTRDRSAQAKRAREARETQRQFEVSARNYQCVRIVGKGAYGVVCEAIDRKARSRKEERVAIKKIKEALFHPLDAKLVLRELKLARLLAKHPNVLGIRTLIKPVSRRNMDTIYVVSNFMDTDLYRLCQSRVELTDKHVRHLMYQTMSGLQFLHSADVLHRDMKTANLLVDRHFNLKICDFGLARLVRPGESLIDGIDDDVKHNDAESGAPPPLTELVVTLWYRAPELVANSNYDAAIDIWAVGCIFAEMLLRRPIFPGKDHLHQLQLITDVMGTPTESDVRSIRGAYARRVLRSLPYRPSKPLNRVFAGAHPQALDLISSLLQFDATKRVTAAQALAHPYFDPVRNSSENILMERSIEEEFAFDKLSDPQLIDMRQMIYDEIMIYHTRTGVSASSSSSSLNSSTGASRGRSKSRTANRNRRQSSTVKPKRKAIQQAIAPTLDSKTEEESSSSDTVLPTNLLVSVEKAQKSSTDLLEEMRRRRVKVQVRAASAALDAALATSAALVNTDTSKGAASIADEAKKMDKSSLTSASKMDSMVEVGPRSPRKRGGPRPGQSGPLCMPGEVAAAVVPLMKNASQPTENPEKLFHRSSRAHSTKTSEVGTFDFEEPDVVHTSSGALSLARAVSSEVVGPERAASTKATTATAYRPRTSSNSGRTTSGSRSLANNRYSSSNYATKRRPSYKEPKASNGYSDSATSWNSQRRPGNTSSMQKSNSSGSIVHRNRSRKNNALSLRAKENTINQITNVSSTASEAKAKRAGRSKKTTVPKPFTFTSRRKQRSTPKHIRFQREALARRAEREAKRGTRRTQFF